MLDEKYEMHEIGENLIPDEDQQKSIVILFFWWQMCVAFLHKMIATQFKVEQQQWMNDVKRKNYWSQCGMSVVVMC